MRLSIKWSQTASQFCTNRHSIRLTATEARRQLNAQKGYVDVQHQTVRTLRTKLNDLDYYPSRVAKATPK
ncbi:MAG: hypothetical protein MI924_05055 [Chloroflexales bacterium]|nr:hypothetical protein [Chloroflexales bacterium]